MPPVLKISETDRFPFKVWCLSHIGSANKIVKQKLTPRQLDMFRRTIFGRLIDIDLIFNSPLIHHILLREVVDERVNAMSFLIRGTIVTFSKEEFLLMTGFWRTPSRVVQNKVAAEGLERKYFGNRSNRTVAFHLKDFEEEYKKLKFENDDDAVKITLVYYTELAMMGKNKQKGVVDRSLLKDVEDLEYYNNIDWGTIIWKRTLKGLQKALKDKVEVYKMKVKSKKKFNVNCTLPGFPYAFQVWAYETLSSVVGVVATRLNDEAMPRILRWSCSRSLSFDLLEKDIFDSVRTVVTPVLRMSVAEQQYRDTQVNKRPVYYQGHGPEDDHGLQDDDGPKDDHGHEAMDNSYMDLVFEHHIGEEHAPKSAVASEPEPSNTGQGKVAHNVFAYLDSINSSVSSLDIRISRVEACLGEMKSQLMTITLLLHTLCKGTSTVDDYPIDTRLVDVANGNDSTYQYDANAHRGTVDVDEHSALVTEATARPPTETTELLSPSPSIETTDLPPTETLALSLTSLAPTIPLHHPPSETLTLTPSPTIAPTDHIPHPPTKTFAFTPTPPLAPTDPFHHPPIVNLTLNLTPPIAPTDPLPHPPTETLTLTLTHSLAPTDPLSHPPIETLITTPHPTPTETLSSSFTEPNPLPPQSLSVKTKRPSSIQHIAPLPVPTVPTPSRRGSQKRKGAQLYTATTMPIKNPKREQNKGQSDSEKKVQSDSSRKFTPTVMYKLAHEVPKSVFDDTMTWLLDKETDLEL